MKKMFIFYLIFYCIISCNNDKNIPDVSGIKIPVSVKRFEKDFFALDTFNLATGLNELNENYPGFTNDFINNILGLSVPALLDNNEKIYQWLQNNGYTNAKKI